MSFLSKEIFDRALKGKTCQHITHHRSASCWKGVKEMTICGIIGSSKFSSLLCALQILSRGKNLRRDHIKNYIEQFIRLSICGTLMNTTFLATSCLLRNILGRFDYYVAMSIPGFFSGLPIFVLHDIRKHIVISAFSTATLETLIFHHTPLKTRKWRKLETLIFMIINSAFLYMIKLWKTTKKNETIPEIWFFSPSSTKSHEISDEKQSTLRPCSHINSCIRNILKESSNYFWFGAAIEMLRVILKNIKTSVEDPMKIFKMISKPSTLRLAAFAGLYVFLFKVTHCALCKFYKEDKTIYALIAGFVSGIAYYIHPNISLSLTAFTNLIHLIWRYREFNKKLPKNFPTCELLHMMFCGLLFHYRMVAPDSCSRFFINLISIATNGRSDEMYANFDRTFIS